MNSQPNDKFVHVIDCKCLSWTPIIAGALAAVGFSFLLNLFSVAIGLTAFTTDSAGIETLVLGGLLGTAIGIIAAMFGAGWISGYLAIRHCEKRHIGALYGFLTWCLALIIAIFLATHAQQYISFYSHFLSGTTMSVSSAAAATTATVTAPTEHVVISTFILFTLFFLSAFAASLGGHCGMRFRCKEDGTTC